MVMQVDIYRSFLSPFGGFWGFFGFWFFFFESVTSPPRPLLSSFPLIVKLSVGPLQLVFLTLPIFWMHGAHNFWASGSGFFPIRSLYFWVGGAPQEGFLSIPSSQQIFRLRYEWGIILTIGFPWKDSAK